MNNRAQYTGIVKYNKSKKINFMKVIPKALVILFSCVMLFGTSIYFKGAIQHKDSSEENKVNNSEGDSSVSNYYVLNWKDISTINDKSKIEFVESIKEPALDSYKQYGILPSITIAQAILESAWGTSELAKEHNNLFGIKADGRWSGAVATIITKENFDDVIEANFRKYDDILQSINDHGEFLFKNERYSDNGLFKGKTYKEQAQALENAGYSTAKNEDGDKIYADKLISIVQKYNLMLFDKEVNR